MKNENEVLINVHINKFLFALLNISKEEGKNPMNVITVLNIRNIQATYHIFVSTGIGYIVFILSTGDMLHHRLATLSSYNPRLNGIIRYNTYNKKLLKYLHSITLVPRLHDKKDTIIIQMCL